MEKYNNFMDDNFKCFYRILRYLEKHLDDEEIDIERISADALHISKYRWLRYMKMLCECEYITGLEIYEDQDGTDYMDHGICITLKGLEYLSENTIMQRIYKSTIKIKSVIS